MRKKKNHVPVPVKESVFFDDIRRDRTASVIYKGYSIFTDGKKFSVDKNSAFEKFPDLFDVLYYNVGVFYSIAPNYFCKTISLERPVHDKIKEIINLYYERVDLDHPEFIENGIEMIDGLSYKGDKNRVAVGLSGGKDSVYALVKCVEIYGADNVLAVYIDNIMKQCPEMERSASLSICSKLGVKIVEVKIFNSFKKHKGILNGAEITMAASLVIPIAMEFNASKVVLGTILSEKDIFDVQAPTFSETVRVINLFNEFIRSLGVDISVESGVPDTKEPMIYLMQNRPEIMAETVSCMMKSNHLKSHMNRSRKNYPDFPFYKRMCGVCVKCMMINVFRMKYEKGFDKLFDKPTINKYCLRVMSVIVKKRYDFKVDVIDEIEDILDMAMTQYELNI